MGIGRSYTIFPGMQDTAPPPEPWDIPVHNTLPLLSSSGPPSVDPQALQDEPRGRNASKPMFGRGDEDGFPALSGIRESSATPPQGTPPRANLAATRPGSAHGSGGSRTYSPAALRSIYFEHVAVASKRSGTSVSPSRADDPGNAKRRSSAKRPKDLSPAWTRSTEMTMQHAVEDDISMVMRQRVVQGYGLVNVRVSVSLTSCPLTIFLQPIHNSVVVQDTSTDDVALSQTWLWINRACPSAQ